MESALDYAVNTKKVVIGGTSAGCAIQGEFLFSAEVDTISSSIALANPYDSKLTIRRNLFKHSVLRNTITDTHYNNPDRRGRHIAFMARIAKDHLMNSDLTATTALVGGIGVEEKTAVCVEGNGMAYVYGTNSAVFVQQNKLTDIPERCISSTALDWYRNKAATVAYKVPGSTTGKNFFNLNTWTSGVGGKWYNYYVDRGIFAAV
jgi:cyanophycinase